MGPLVDVVGGNRTLGAVGVWVICLSHLMAGFQEHTQTAKPTQPKQTTP